MLRLEVGYELLGEQWGCCSRQKELRYGIFAPAVFDDNLTKDVHQIADRYDVPFGNGVPGDMVEVNVQNVVRHGQYDRLRIFDVVGTSAGHPFDFQLVVEDTLKNGYKHGRC